MDDILGLGRAPAGADGGRIKDLFRARFGLDPEVTLMVTELRCHEDGCPDVETVIAVMAPGAPAEKWKLAKPMAAVTEADIDRLSGGA